MAEEGNRGDEEGMELVRGAAVNGFSFGAVEAYEELAVIICVQL